MNTPVIVSDVQNLNREFLLAAHNALLHDPVAAGFVYHLPRIVAHRLLHASISEIGTFTQRAGGICLMAPVPSIVDLFDVPEDLFHPVAISSMQLAFLRERSSNGIRDDTSGQGGDG